MHVIDASFLLLFLNPTAPAPLDPATQQPVEQSAARIRHLIHQLDEQKAKLVIPTPALAEVLIRADNAGPQYLQTIRDSRFFQVEPFGNRAAVEAAALLAARIKKHGSLRGPDTDSKAKLKFDHQILAIARVSSAATIYTDDRKLQNHANEHGMQALGVADLSVPPEADQTEFPFSSDEAD